MLFTSYHVCHVKGSYEPLHASDSSLIVFLMYISLLRCSFSKHAELCSGSWHIIRVTSQGLRSIRQNVKSHESHGESV